MPTLLNETAAPAVSIILPTYNRAHLLPRALRSIRAQTYTDWELIVVDDGSTDHTRDFIAEAAAGMPQPLRYKFQENRGAYGARNTGLDCARGRYVAFFDSDDEWLPHHLQTCVEALNSNPDVDWVYGAGRWVDDATGRVLNAHSFYEDGQLRPFFRLRTRLSGKLRIIEDEDAVKSMVSNVFLSGLQKSVFRNTVFRQLRFDTGCRNEAEDQVFAVRALKGGHRCGFFNDVHLVYHVHEQNSSLSATGGSLDKSVEQILTLIRGYEALPGQVRLTRTEGRALRRRISSEYFWTLGYAVLWRSGRRREALAMYLRGLHWYPWCVGYWKSLSLACVRYVLGGLLAVGRSSRQRRAAPGGPYAQSQQPTSPDALCQQLQP
jgi:glycosyltransferase involved in cell wall biosynthesis